MKKQLPIIEISSISKQVPESVPSQFIGIAILFSIFLISFFFLIYSGFTLTITRGQEFAALADSNSIGKQATFGERGMIVDRNGVALVQNIKSYDVYIDPTVAKEKDITGYFSAQKDDLHKIFTSKEQLSTMIVHDAPKELVVQLQEKNLPGVELRHSYVRQYLYPAPFAHLLGYTGVASDDDLASDPLLVRNQIVGKSGLEYQYDTQLQGELRYDTYEKDAFGNQITSSAIVAPQQGETLTLTIYKKYQQDLYGIVKKAVDDHKAKGGSAVLLDINTGEIMALVSYPAFDPNQFVSGISVADYAKLINSPQTPLLDRPIAAQEPPGSTFKTIVATAALETGAITDTTQYLASGTIRLAGGELFQDYHQHYYGILTVREALMVSSNIFFCRTAMKLGIDKLVPYVEAFGIGKRSGIDLPGEMPGRVPSPENKIWLANNGASWLDPIWYPEGDTCNSAIGQGIALATPLQMANVAEAVANGGTIYKPHVVQKITDANGNVTTTAPVIIAKNIASDATLQVVREGMRMAVAAPRGVVSSLRYVPMEVAAKTGTAEFGVKDKNGYSTTHAWVIGFYPYQKPQYAFAMLIEGGGSSSVASFAMRDFLNMTR